METTQLQPVERLAKREDSIYRALAAGVIREAAMLAVLRTLLPG